MGALNEPIQRLKVKKLGKKIWERNLELVNNFWTKIEQATESLALPYERVRLYQDGLPVCGHESEDRQRPGQGGEPEPSVAA